MTVTYLVSCSVEPVVGSASRLCALNAARVACHHTSWAAGTVAYVACQTPRLVEIGGDFLLHTRAPDRIAPAEATTCGTPSSCSDGDCYSDRLCRWLPDEFERHDRGQHNARSRIALSQRSSCAKFAAGSLQASASASPPLK